MWRAVTKTSTHLNTKTNRKNHNSRYPNNAPPREEKINSPEPMVSDAMTAPGPKIVTHASGLRDCSASGSRSGLVSPAAPDLEFIGEKIHSLSGLPASGSRPGAGRPREFLARGTLPCG